MPAAKTASSGLHTGLFLAILLLSILFGFKINPQRSLEPADVYNALGRHLAKRAGAAAPQKIIKSKPSEISWAFAFNVCIDAILRFDGVFQDGQAQGKEIVPRDLLAVEGEEDALSLFAHYFSEGAAAERTCDPAVFAKLVAKANAAKGTRENLGGNAALMSRQMAKLGAKTMLIGGNVGRQARALLPYGATFATGAASSGGSNAQEVQDEVHLILEYAKGDTFAPSSKQRFTAPRANRLILTADATNQNAQALLETIKAADSDGNSDRSGGSSDLLVIAGLHMLSPVEPAKRLAVLQQTAKALKSRKTPFAVHLELASMADAGFMREIAEVLFPLVDSVGFNEQEAAFLYESLGGKFAEDESGKGGLLGSGIKGSSRHSITSHQSPDVASIASLLRFLFERFPNAFSRVHFHSLGYHIIAYSGKAAVGGSGIALSATKEALAAANSGLERMAAENSAGSAATVRRWKATTAAVAAGALTATREACALPLGDAASLSVAAAPESSVSNSLLHFAAPLEVNIHDPRKPVPQPAAKDAGDSAKAAPSGKGDFTTPHSKLFLSSMAPAGEWTWNSTTAGPLRYTIAPVAVCNKPVSTVGLGDAISAAGLAYDALTVAEVEQLLAAAEHEEAEALEHSWPILRVVRKWKNRVQELVLKVKEQFSASA